MAEKAPVAEADPHVVRKSAEETDGEFVRFESTMYPAPDADATIDLSHERWGLDNDFEHVHPEQAERWSVLAGELRVELEGTERTVSEGDDITLPAGVAHRHWNPTAEPVRVVWERHPAYRTSEWAESVYALAQAGETDDDGVPNVLQSAVLFDAYEEESPYFAAVPVAAQQVAASLLAPVGRAAGYEANYSRPEREGNRSDGVGGFNGR